ncbi:hypothetical protein PspTeo4_13544 [Pseudomonas sp. Teo4]|nr:hypothetical protein [Pseudomonas sp. Teo4]
MADDYRDGKLHTLNIFGTRLVAFASSTGDISILDAFCPHMGADLSQGTIENDTVVCPFHHWKYDTSGKCVEIPYCKRIPPKAKTRSWLTCEENNLLFVWNNPEGRPPKEGVVIPHLPEMDDPEWIHEWNIDTMLIDTNPRELVDNLVDAQHFGPVHGTPTKYFANVFEGHIGRQIFHGDSSAWGRPDCAVGLLRAGHALYRVEFDVRRCAGARDSAQQPRAGDAGQLRAALWLHGQAGAGLDRRTEP